jgi:hypothetical protein
MLISVSPETYTTQIYSNLDVKRVETLVLRMPIFSFHCLSMSPKDSNMDNPLQAEGAARGMSSTYRNSEVVQPCTGLINRGGGVVPPNCATLVRGYANSTPSASAAIL